MNITHVLASVSRANGGISESVRRLAQAQHALGRDHVRVISLEDHFTRDDLPTWQPLTPRCLPVRGPSALGFAPGMVSAIGDTRPDLTHVAGLWMYPSVANLRWSLNAHHPTVIAPHGMLDPWALANSAWKKRIAALAFERRHLEHAACLHALCESEADSIRAYGLRNPVCVIPNGIDVPQLPDPPPPAPWTGTIPDDEKVVLFLGRLHPKKGLQPLIEAWSTAKPDGWRLVIAGWDQSGHEADLRTLATTRGVADRILFTGPLHGPAKQAAYANATGFVLSSFSEGLPMTVLEAWAFGLPVLMTPACNLPEGFAAHAALEVSTDSGELARSLLLFTSMSPEERAAMGRRGRELAQTRFHWPRIAAEMDAVYDWILGAGPSPACVRS